MIIITIIIIIIIMIIMKRIWQKEKVEVIPIIIGALGAIPKSLKKNLERIGADCRLRLDCCKRVFYWAPPIVLGEFSPPEKCK